LVSFILSLVERNLTGSLGGIFALGAFLVSWLGSIFVAWLLCQIIGWLYYAFFESRGLQATPGKLLLSLKVVGGNSESISFWRSTLRHILKSAAFFPALLLFVMLGITLSVVPRSESLTLLGILFGVSLLLFPILFFIFYGMAGWTQEKRALHDRFSGCYVARKTRLSDGRMFGTVIGIIMFTLVLRFIVPGLGGIINNIKVVNSSAKLGGEVYEK
ncbi:MAG: RDD family protein, partial [Candidatus Omnitrophica bacterium]|nr:RDD family protein [Candidatus Omnitrophota bacterium]